jgi:hypothetical protein
MVKVDHVKSTQHQKPVGRRWQKSLARGQREMARFAFASMRLHLFFAVGLFSATTVFAVDTSSSPSDAQPAPSRHVLLTNVNSQFLQSGGSCVLASYAVVANYFTGKPISTYFEGYCRHFGLTYANASEAEEKYATHFDAEWRKRNCRGYEVILDLHSNSTVSCFAEARKVFAGRFYLDSSAHVKELENRLGTNEAFLNITYEPGRDYHSITIMNDGNDFVARDTNRKGLHPISGLRRIGKLRDSVLYFRRS